MSWSDHDSSRRKALTTASGGASAWIGVQRDGGRSRVVMVNGLTMDVNGNTAGTGTEAARADLSGGRIRLRASAGIRPGAPRPGTFSCSTDGVTFVRPGPAFTMGTSRQFFMGHRFAIFNHATQALGGSVRVPRFALSTP